MGMVRLEQAMFHDVLGFALPISRDRSPICGRKGVSPARKRRTQCDRLRRRSPADAVMSRRLTPVHASPLAPP
jgi:hypothetical protein